MTAVYLNAVGAVNALGGDIPTIREAVLAGSTAGMRRRDDLMPHKSTYVGAISAPLVAHDRAYPQYASRNIRILNTAVAQIQPDIDAAIERFGAHRVGVVLGSCTSGTDEGIDALTTLAREGHYPPDYDYQVQELSTPSEYLRQKLGLGGPAWCVSTACTSSAKSFSSGRRLLMTGLCDAVIVGGVDALSRLTLNGFDSLESLDANHCQPFSASRRGINIGEAAAIFLMTREPGPVALLGIGETCDAHHISAPDPEGKGAEAAMRMALKQAGARADAVDYCNLHGTATVKNDLMESHAVERVLGRTVPCSSTKSMLGHTMGTAGATEAAICWMLLTQTGASRLPPNVSDQNLDADLAPIHLSDVGERADCALTLSNSFAFGGNNACLALARGA